MGVASWAIPVGTLGGIVALGFIFVWWWFPRAWQGGVNADHTEVNATHGAEREAQRAKNREIIDRFSKRMARERGEVVNDEHDVELGHVAPPPAYGAGTAQTAELGTESRGGEHNVRV